MKAAYLLGVRPVASGADLHSETLSQRKRAMDWLYRGSRVPFFPPGRGVQRRRGPVRLLQPLWVRGRRVETPALGLRQRGQPMVGEGERPALEAGKQRALAGVRETRREIVIASLI